MRDHVSIPSYETYVGTTSTRELMHNQYLQTLFGVCVCVCVCVCVFRGTSASFC